VAMEFRLSAKEESVLLVSNQGPSKHQKAFEKEKYGIGKL